MTVDALQSLPGTSSLTYRAPDKSLWFGGESCLWHRVGDRLTKVELPAEAAGLSMRLVVTSGPDDSGDVGNVTAQHARGPDVWIRGEFGLQPLDQGRFRTLRALDEKR